MNENEPTYLAQHAPWPEGDWQGETPTMADVVRFWAGLGTAQASISVDLVHDPRWRLNCETVQHAHDVVFLLAELAAVDLGRAERAAHRIWLAAEAGDSYGEWLWQWATEAGLDADRITDEAQVWLAADREAEARS